MTKFLIGVVIAGVIVAGCSTNDDSSADSTASPTGSPAETGEGLEEAMQSLVDTDDGPPGIIVVVNRDPDHPDVYAAGVANVEADEPIDIEDHMRLASVAKAFSGAAALAAVAAGELALTDTIGERLPDLPADWAEVTLQQMLSHTSGLPDFSQQESFQTALADSLTVAPPPRQLLSFAEGLPLEFPPGTEYKYSNSDNVATGLMVEAATGISYDEVLQSRVYGPLGLSATSLPAGPEIPTPFVHGYSVDPPEPPEDVSELFAAGWAWAAGGIVSTPQDTARFIRGYVSGEISDVRSTELEFRPGESDPPGPGENNAGAALFRYDTECGTVYGHTGNTAGYTQFTASTEDGDRSVVVSVNAQLTPKSAPERFEELRAIYEAAVCEALGG